MPAWPASLPQEVLRDGYSEQRQSGVVRTSMDTGPDFVRRRTTATVRSVSAQIVLTGAEVETLRTFFETTLLMGSDAFDWTDPIGGAAVSMRFREAPRITAIGGDHYTVSLQLEILP